MYLNDDIISHIYSFLPVRDISRDIKNIVIKQQLIQYIMYKKWLNFYFHEYTAYPHENYLDWLDNDISRWCNNDIPTLVEFTTKYLNIMNRICPKPFLKFRKFTTVQDRIKNYFYSFTLEEVNELDKFLTNIHFTVS
jgi:hypothetical protein